MKKGKLMLLPIWVVCFGILLSIPTEAGIWERYYWNGFLYILDTFKEDAKYTDIHNYYGKEEKITIPKKVRGIKVISVISLGKKPGIREVHIPNGVRIDASALSQIPTLEKITVNKNNPDYMVKNGLLLSKDGKTLVSCPGGFESVNIPDSVIDIQYAAFEGSSIKEITLGKNISRIDGGAFHNCKNLKKVHFQEGIYVESLNFSDCTSLESITLPEGVKDIKFSGCASLKSIVLPDSVESCEIFSCRNLERVVAGKNLKFMEEFRNTPKLREVSIYSKDCKVMNEDMWGQECYMIYEGSKCMDQVTVYGVEGSQTIEMAKKYGITHKIVEEQEIDKEIGKEKNQNWEYILSTEHGKTSATITGFYGKEKHLTIPSTIGEIPVSTLKSLGSSSYVETVSIPDGIHVVGDALSSCKKLKIIQLSGKNSLYQVVNKMLLSKDGKTLISCPGNIKYPKIPSTVKKVADGAFSGSKIRKVTIGKNITDLGKIHFKIAKNFLK